MDLDMFRPPVNRSMRLLDRAFFQKEVPTSAARLLDVKSISHVQRALDRSKEALQHQRLKRVVPDPEGQRSSTGGKCMLLQPSVQHDNNATWSEALRGLTDEGKVGVIPYTLHLQYEDWDANEILCSVLPSDLLDEVPSSFAHIGHIAHLNLRDQYLPYKHLIGQVILDKNPTIRTVINKVDTLNSDNKFRVLPYELIAGVDETLVETKEHGCIYRFDYSKCYWNARLDTEHARVVGIFKEGDAVCDVMAGVGPFAIPAGKRKVFVWANDLNPDCHRAMKENMRLNNVGDWVTPFCEDGHSFIRSAARRLLDDNHRAKVPMAMSRKQAETKGIAPTSRYTYVTQPKTFSHFVMNLPGTAIEFLPDFWGVYAGEEKMFEPFTQTKLPKVHCYCFGPKARDDDEGAAKAVVRDKVSEKLGSQEWIKDPETTVEEVRDVAPNSCQFRVSFRLPPNIAFHQAAP